MTDIIRTLKGTVRMAFAPDSLTNDQRLLSERMKRCLGWAAWAELAVIPLCMFVGYWYYLTLKGGSSPLRYLTVKIVLGTIGGASACGGVLLSKSMWAYWKHYDTSAESTKKFWYWVMTLTIGFGCAPYYHLVYRPQVEDRTMEGK